MISGVLDLDFIEELKLRRWARENYVPAERRKQNWHPVVLDEMEKKDFEASYSSADAGYAYSVS